MMRLAYPLALLLLVLLIPLAYLWTRRARRPVIRFSSLDTLRAVGGGWRARLRGVLPLLRTIALICLIVAVARPQRADESSRVFAEGVAIQMVVDVSSSMTDTDLSPRGQNQTRLDVVKNVFRRFVKGDNVLKGRTNDLIGVVKFARYADSICPLTLDYDNLLAAVDSITTVPERLRQTEDGTAIGDGLSLAVERLKDLKRTTGAGQQLVIKSRVVILLTDGENNQGMIMPQQAGELAATYGIKVYTIMAGTGAVAGFGRLPLDDSDMRRIAEVTGGKFYEARNVDALEKVYADIDALERTKVEERRFVRWGERSRPWLLAAFSCLCVQMLLDATLLRKIP